MVRKSRGRSLPLTAKNGAKTPRQTPSSRLVLLETLFQPLTTIDLFSMAGFQIDHSRPPTKSIKNWPGTIVTPCKPPLAGELQLFADMANICKNGFGFTKAV